MLLSKMLIINFRALWPHHFVAGMTKRSGNNEEFFFDVNNVNITSITSMDAPSFVLNRWCMKDSRQETKKTTDTRAFRKKMRNFTPAEQQMMQ